MLLGLTCAVLLVALLASAPANAQVLYGSIVGTVEDPTGAVVPGATITLTNPSTGATREIKADDQGRYSVPNLQAGTYDLKVASQGFRTLTRTGVEITINTVNPRGREIEVGQMTEQVTVSASAVALQTDKSDVRSELASQAITSLPLPGYRNYQTLINLVPGATPAGFQNAVVDTPGRALTTNVNGTARNTNNTLNDGAVNINVWLPHHTAYVQPVESIETVNITTNSFDAEQGMAGGAAITVTTKSGTNDIHGVGFWFHNNQHLNTAPYFRSSTYKLPLTIFNQGGGTIGGPIKKDKLFYFFSYEQTWERTGNTGNYSVAPQEFRDGNFSNWTNIGIVYDPASAPMTNAAARTPFGNNTVPKARFNSIFPNIYKDMPLPNQKSPTDLQYNLGGNYGKSAVLRLDRKQYDVKVNWTANEKLAIWGKYSRMDAPVQGRIRSAIWAVRRSEPTVRATRRPNFRSSDTTTRSRRHSSWTAYSATPAWTRRFSCRTPTRMSVWTSGRFRAPMAACSIRATTDTAVLPKLPASASTTLALVPRGRRCGVTSGATATRLTSARSWERTSSGGAVKPAGWN